MYVLVFQTQEEQRGGGGTVDETKGQQRPAEVPAGLSGGWSHDSYQGLMSL